MGNEAGEWILYGVDEDAEECLHTADELIDYVNQVGFLPLFKNEIPGFSVEERTTPLYWWSGIVEKDPWEWRAVIARSGKLAYGKFFDKKAGFISLDWLPAFVNYRRDGYDFDALWDDGRAQVRQKKIMDHFLGENEDEELLSFVLKNEAGFGKDGEKNFEGVVTALQMEMYLCIREFRQKRNKRGEEYGWALSVYATPEHIWGREMVTSAYGETPTESAERIADHLKDVYPVATDAQIKNLIGSGIR